MGPLLLVVVAFVVMGGGMIAFVWFANRAIGRHYDRKAATLLGVLAADGVLFSEAEVRTSAKWVAPFAFAYRSTFNDVAVTPRGIYLLQWRRFFGGRMGQPVLAALRAGVDPSSTAALVHAIHLAAGPGWDGSAVVLAGQLGRQRFEMRLMLKDPRAFLTAVYGPGMASR